MIFRQATGAAVESRKPTYVPDCVIAAAVAMGSAPARFRMPESCDFINILDRWIHLPEIFAFRFFPTLAVEIYGCDHYRSAASEADHQGKYVHTGNLSPMRIELTKEAGDSHVRG